MNRYLFSDNFCKIDYPNSESVQFYPAPANRPIRQPWPTKKSAVLPFGRIRGVYFLYHSFLSFFSTFGLFRPKHGQLYFHHFHADGFCSLSIFRGLKPLATIVSSLRDFILSFTIPILQIHSKNHGHRAH